MVRVTKPGIRTGSRQRSTKGQAEGWSDKPGIRTGGVHSESGIKAGSGIRQEADRMQVQGLMGNIHQGTDCRSGH
ncbi:unnamed protein product, partial [Staurois parvus]